MESLSRHSWVGRINGIRIYLTQKCFQKIKQKRIFSEWEIENDKFVALKMENGDDCGPIGSRRTRILFKCDRNSTKTEIEQAAEPSTCNYEITLSTSVICSDDDDVTESTMNVYPHLNATLKTEWDMIFSDLKNDLITEKVTLFTH